MPLTRKTESLVVYYFLFCEKMRGVLDVRDLDVFVDSRLYFRLQVLRIVNQGLCNLGVLLGRTRTLRNSKCLLSLYCALVRSRLGNSRRCYGTM